MISTLEEAHYVDCGQRGVGGGEDRAGSVRILAMVWKRVESKHLMGLERDIAKRESGNWLDLGGEANR